MRTVTEIAQAIKKYFMANETLQAAYGLDVAKSFDEQFAGSSLEAILIHLVALSVASLEWLFDLHKKEVDEKVKSALPGSIAWYHNLVMNFEYAGEKIIHYCAIVETSSQLMIKVNAENYGVLADESDQLIALRAYMKKNKFAGTRLFVASSAPDEIRPALTVWLDPLVFDSEGKNLVSKTKAVEEGIDNYLAGIIYNGTFNKTKMVDAIQQVEGVVDVKLDGVSVTVSGESSQPVEDNNWQSHGGAFSSPVKDIVYVFA